jgi:hypothetical protein
LVDRPGKRQILGAGQNPSTRLKVFVDDPREIGRQLRCSLDLVDDRTISELPEESAGIFGREGSDIRGLEIGVGMIAKDGLAQRGLPARPRLGEGHGWELARCSVQTSG